MAAKTPEGKLQARVIAWTLKRHVTAIRLSFRRGVTAGWPDILFLLPGGCPLFIEFKAPGKKPTPLQEQRLKQLHELGYAATWTDNFDAACAFIASAMESATVHAAGSRSLDDPYVGGFSAGPWTRKDLDYASSVFSTQKPWSLLSHVGSGAAESLPPSVEAGRPEVDRVPSPENDFAARAEKAAAPKGRL